MRRLAGALALVFMFVAVTLSLPAAARQNTYARVKCAGLYCAIVSVPAPRLRQGYGGQACGGHGVAPQSRRRHGGRARVRGSDAARPHHAVIIRDYLGDGRALVYDANSGGHLTRIHVRSLRGYSIRNPRGG